MCDTDTSIDSIDIISIVLIAHLFVRVMKSNQSLTNARPISGVEVKSSQCLQVIVNSGICGSIYLDLIVKCKHDLIFVLPSATLVFCSALSTLLAFGSFLIPSNDIPLVFLNSSGSLRCFSILVSL